jgi:hypothetical protein
MLLSKEYSVMMRDELFTNVDATDMLLVDADNLEDTDLFADELDERYNAGTVSSSTCFSSASCAGSSSASCACTTSCLCSAG